MPSTVLVERPREEAQLPGGSQGVRIASVESRICGISLSRAERDTQAMDARPFDFDVDLSESARTEDTLSVRYSYTFGRPATGQVCKVNGTALVRFSQFNPADDFHTLGNDITSEMAVRSSERTMKRCTCFSRRSRWTRPPRGSRRRFRCPLAAC
jgi:hypothetical protein